MTDYSKMTDDELNEAIFKAKGGNKEFVEAYKKEMFEWSPVASIARWQYAAPDYTHDWRLAGELLEELPASTRMRIMCMRHDIKRHICVEWLAWKGQK